MQEGKEEKRSFERKNNVPKNYVELPEQQQIFNDLSKLETELANKQTLAQRKETLNQVKSKLRKMTERIQKSNLEKKDKEKVFIELNIFQENIDQNINQESLNNQFKDILNSLDQIIQTELKTLRSSIFWFNSKTQRPTEVQQWIDKSSEKIPELIAAAKNDKSWFVRNVIAELLERANS